MPAVATGRLPALLGLGLVLTGVFAPNPVLLLLGLVAAGTGPLARRLPLDLAILASVGVLILAAVTLGVVAGLLGGDLLARPWLLAGTYVAVAAAALAVTCRPRLTAAPAFELHPLVEAGRGPSNPWMWLVHGPAVFATATALLQTLRPGVAASWSFWATDIVRHMGALAGVQQDGSLDMTATGYPRGLHMLAALVSVPGAPLDDRAALLPYNLQLIAAMTWLSMALVLATGAAVVARLARVLGLAPSSGAAAAFLLGLVALLSGSFVTTFAFMGAMPSLVAMAILWAMPLALLASPRLDRWGPVVACCATCSLLLCYLWQALAVVPVAALALYLVPLVRPSRPSSLRRPGRRAVLTWTAVTVVVTTCALLAAPSLIAIQRGGGVGLASTLGSTPPDPYQFLAPGLVGVSVLLWRMRHGWARLVLGSVVGLVAVVAVMLAGAGRGLDFDQYYPMKALWFLAAFLSPLAALAVIVGASSIRRRTSRALGRTGRSARVLRVSAVALVLAVAGAFWLPTELGAGSVTATTWRRSDLGGNAKDQYGTRWGSERYEIGRKYGDAYPGAVTVPYFVGYDTVIDSLGTRVPSSVMSFLTGQPEVAGDGMDICAKITLVARAGRAVVVSKLSAGTVKRDMLANGCAGRARVVHVPGYLHMTSAPPDHS